MAILSGLFGGGNSDSGSDLLGVLDGALGVNASSESYNQSVDDDGSSETSYNTTDFGLDLDIGSILSNMTDTSSDGDSGGIFG